MIKIIFRRISFIYFLGALAVSIYAVNNCAIGVALALIGTYIYLVPPIIFRTLFLLLRSKLGSDLRKLPVKSKLGDPTFALWWVSSQLQVHYLRFPFLEEIIKSFPGLYSMWLRLWGAQIGKNVLWTPSVLIVDRPFISVGDDAIIGTESRMTPHLVNQRNGEIELILGIIYIGARSTVGGSANLFPGALIADDEIVPTMGIVNNAPRSKKSVSHV